MPEGNPPAGNIAVLRRRWKMSQEALGALMGVSRNVVVNWERGRTELSLAELSHLGELAGVSVAALKGGILDAGMVSASPVTHAADMKDVVRRLERIENLLMQLIESK